MSTVERLLQLHAEGKITDIVLNNALTSLNFEAVLNEKKSQKNPQKLQLTDKPLCNYFKTYEIDATKYKDPILLFEDKKTEIITQIKKDIKEFNGVKFSLGLSLEFYKDDKDGTRKFFSAQKHGDQSAVLSRSNPEKFYDEQSDTIQRWIENFTNVEGTGAAINHCIRIYLNIGKYEPLKGSSYIKTPEIIANTKCVVNVQNDDEKCLEWALKSALYPVKTQTERISSYIGNPP